MNSLSTTIAEINICLKAICKEEADLIDSKFLSIFKNKNYRGIGQSLDIAVTRLKSLIETLDEIQDDRNNFSDRYLAILGHAIQYSENLFLSTLELQKINLKLFKKTLGEPYSMSQHWSDVAYFYSLKDGYSMLGYRLNSEFYLYARELEKEEEDEYEEEDEDEDEDESNHTNDFDPHIEFTKINWDIYTEEFDKAIEFINHKAKNPDNIAWGVKQLTRLAEMGMPKAQYKLGMLYCMGNGVERDMGKYIFWMEKCESVYGSANYAEIYRRLQTQANSPQVQEHLASESEDSEDSEISKKPSLGELLKRRLNK
jgi:hypothetical protein